MAKPKFDVGQMRHRITIMRDTLSPPNSVGQRKPTYATLGPYYAFVLCVGGQEDINGNQQKGLLKWRVTMRYNVAPTRPTDRIIWQSHTLEVANIVPDPLKYLAVVECIEKVAVQ